MLWHNSILAKGMTWWLHGYKRLSFTSHIWNSCSAAHATNSQQNPSQYSTTQKQKTKEKQEIQSTYEIANHMGSIQDPKFKDSWEGGPSSMMTDNSHAKLRSIGLHIPLPARACAMLLWILAEFMCVQWLCTVSSILLHLLSFFLFGQE